MALLPSNSPSVVLDPACGDGELLEAIVRSANPLQRQHISLIGVDRDQQSISTATDRLSYLDTTFQTYTSDFLDLSSVHTTIQPNLFDFGDQISSPVIGAVDAIISNPPYVRTQVLGSIAAQQLASRFGLSGRVDLYHAFVGAMTDHLSEGGILGLLCSNRFLTTQGGSSLRRILAMNYELLEIIDLGDTKLFAAAVLPAIVIARKGKATDQSQCAFARVYEVRRPNGNKVTPHPTVVSALSGGAEGQVEVGNTVWDIERGHLSIGPTVKTSWTLASNAITKWLETVEKHTYKTFGDVSPVRVGIKSNADKIFLRRDWDDLEETSRPEHELLHPVITHHIARRWIVDPEQHDRRVLYPHAVRFGKRTAIDLSQFPRTATYLEQYREQLESREYLIKGKRKWYEIWVAQDPAAWPKPKLIFPDISESPKFSLDITGAIVNGDCYWMLLDRLEHPHDASVMLAVANSTFSERFYDAVCGNRLYAGRRRYITQYVEKFPIPQLAAKQRDHIHALVEQLRGISPENPISADKEEELDSLVWSAFGLPKEA